MDKSRADRIKKERKSAIKRKVVSFLFLTALLLGVTFVYAGYQYESGRNQALENLDIDPDEEDIEFNPFEEDKDSENGYINVLLIGADNEGDGAARTDTIMVAQYRPKEGTVRIASIMRDTYVSIPGYRDNKINTSFFLGGPELLRKTIKENFDININYYALVDFNGFVQTVDTIAPDGIELDIEKRMYYHDSYGDLLIDFQPGPQNLDGEETLKYVRFRSDHENDFGRVRRQQEVLTVLKDELLSVSGITKLPRLVGTIEPYIQTNLDNRKILSLGKDFFLNPINDIETLTIPVNGGYTDRRYSHAGSVLELDFEKNKEVISEFFSLTDNNDVLLTDEQSINESASSQ
ncbi:LCP family protein [Anaerobacillus sp. MEB173]|uniref:LCP family protein n=1 Tax=Anaerobacillus sp. MEB173 TaxID=3383345 RepID=UPI003F9360EC